MTTTGPMRLTGPLARFKQDHPGVEFGVHEGDLATLQGQLDAGDLDLAVLHAPSARAAPCRSTASAMS